METPDQSTEYQGIAPLRLADILQAEWAFTRSEKGENEGSGVKPSQRIVQRIPVNELWNDHEVVLAQRSRALGADDIRALLSNGIVQFVVANCGEKLRWIDSGQTFTFWKQEALSHLAEADEQLDVRNFAGNYCYVASEWSCPDGSILILLEKHH